MAIKKLTRLKTNRELITSHLDSANDYKRFFSTIGCNLSNEIPNSNSEQILEKPNFSMRNISVTELEIDKIITSMQNKTFTGFDKSSNVIVRASRVAIVPVLKTLIDKPFKSASFPSSLVRAVNHPLYKEGSNSF